ncbi:MAG: hypothetical protein RL139_802 [Gemmatimonadota bacterium]
MSDQKICPTCGTEYPLSERFCPRDGTALRSAAGQGDLLGTVVADRYHILKKLGAGGMGTVYLAEHVKMGRKSALKVMNPGMNADPDAIARFNREAANASRLNHPNVCGIYDFGETPDGTIYLAMEFIEGSALTDLIEKQGALAPARAGSIVHQTADALQVAHDAGIVHRDLKPDNIMVARNRDGSDLVKVVDFGIAKASSSDAQKVTKTGLVVGTPEYMSPEQLAGDKLDGRSDIYALGLVAFNCLTGTLPFAANSAQEAMIMRLTDVPRTLAAVRPDVDWPAELQRTLDLALARDAAERYQSAAQFGREFAAAVADMPASADTEAGTMVVSAPSLPATRVAKPGGATAAAAAVSGARSPAQTPATATAKSRTPLIAGGLVTAAAAAGFVWKLGLAGGVAPTSASADSTGAVGVAAAVPTATPGPDVQLYAKNGADVPSTEALAGRPVAPTTPAATPPTNARGTVASRTTAGPAPTTAPAATAASAPAAAPPDVGAQLSALLRDAQNGGASRVLRELAALQPALSGTQLGESYYVQMIAYTDLEDQAGVCRAAKQVLATHTVQSRIALAQRAAQLMQCDGEALR